MERLTKYDFDFNGRKVATVDYTKIRMNTHFDENGRNAEDYYFGKAIDKLAEYENAEEQGLIIKFPVKIKDKLWFTMTDKTIEPVTVIGYSHCISTGFKVVCKSDNGMFTSITIPFDSFLNASHRQNRERTIFLTETEALQALKERERE